MSVLSMPARSAYRTLWRASSATFAGDAPVLTAFREKMRIDAQNWRTLQGQELDEQVQLAKDVAKYLRQNIAQIRKTNEADDTWQLQIREGHEIGDNSTIKNPPPTKIPPKGKRVRPGQSSQTLLGSSSDLNNSLHPSSRHDSSQVNMCSSHLPGPSSVNVVDEQAVHLQEQDLCTAAFNSEQAISPNIEEAEIVFNDESTHGIDVVAADPEDAAPTMTTKPMFYSQLKKVAKKRVLPELNENDIDEVFVRGHGPGGQSINKTNNNVQIIHRPSGIRVVCQETRSLALNRMFARRILLEKLDKIANPGLSKGEVTRAKMLERERRKRKKAKNNVRDEEDRAKRKALRKEEKRAKENTGREDDEDDD